MGAVEVCAGDGVAIVMDDQMVCGSVCTNGSVSQKFQVSLVICHDAGSF